MSIERWRPSERVTDDVSMLTTADLKAMTRTQLNLVFASTLTLALIGGCSDGRPSRVPIAGQVLIDGKPLPHGMIRFIPADHRASRGTIDAQGHFVLSCFADKDGAVAGQHKVEVVASEFVPAKKILRWHAPKKYRTAETSGLTFDVTEPTESAVINLTWDGGVPFDEVFIGRDDY